MVKVLWLCILLEGKKLSKFFITFDPEEEGGQINKQNTHKTLNFIYCFQSLSCVVVYNREWCFTGAIENMYDFPSGEIPK